VYSRVEYDVSLKAPAEDCGQLFWRENLDLRSIFPVVKKAPLMGRDVSVVLTGARLLFAVHRYSCFNQTIEPGLIHLLSSSVQC
jgi:hypothetical protein